MELVAGTRDSDDDNEGCKARAEQITSILGLPLPLTDLSHVHISIIESSLGCYCWTVLALSFFTILGEHSRTNVIESSENLTF